MKTSESLVEVLLDGRVCPPWGPTPTEAQFRQWQAAERIVQVLLEEPAVDNPLAEASVHKPKRGRVYMAVFTGPRGGQIWRSTGRKDREQALVLARQWEAQARSQRARAGLADKKPSWRVRRPASSTGICLLSQREVGMLLNLSERAVRQIERRAFEKLRSHPLMRQIWQQYLAGELEEHRATLSKEEVEAVSNMARTPPRTTLDPENPVGDLSGWLCGPENPAS
jgi:hypothetical protein